MSGTRLEDDIQDGVDKAARKGEADAGRDPARAMEEARHIDAPPARPITPAPSDEKQDHMAEREARAEDRQEALLDEALEETFPGSDPISPKHIT
jgi:hypothetical protein